MRAAFPSPSPLATRRLINIGHMLSGNFTNAGIMLIAVALAARALGPQVFGSMVLLLALSKTVERLISFETWQPLIKFVADEEVQADPMRVARLYGFGLILDIGTATLSALITFAAALALRYLFGWQSISPSAAAIYAAGMLVNVAGAATAALRLAGRFRTVAYVQLPANLLRVVMAAICFWQGAGLLAFMIAWTLAEAAHRLALLALGLHALRSQGIPNPATVPLRGLRKDFPHFLSFAWSVNLSTMLRTLTTTADELVVGALAGPAAVSMYSLAKRFTKLGREVGSQVQTVIYPELARMWSSGNAALFRATVWRTQLVLASIGMLVVATVWLLGRWVIEIALGQAYLGAYPLLSVQVIAVLFALTSEPGRSALLSIGLHRAILGIAATGTILFYALMVPAIWTLGLVGASIAHVALAATTALLIDLVWRRYSRAPNQGMNSLALQ